MSLTIKGHIITLKSESGLHSLGGTVIGEWLSLFKIFLEEK
jgi:hypothetical protein